MVEVEADVELVHRIAIVEDHALQRERTEQVLRQETGLRIVCRCETLPQFVEWLRVTPAPQHPHLLILDLSVDRGPAADPAVVSKLVRSGMVVLVLSAMAVPALVRDMIRAGASGFVGKRDSPADLVAAVHTVLRQGSWITSEMAAVMAADPGRPALSDQEQRVLVLYSSGLTLAAVADRIGVRPDTAKEYLRRVKAKYGQAGREVRSKIDLRRAAELDGYLEQPVR